MQSLSFIRFIIRYMKVKGGTLGFVLKYKAVSIRYTSFLCKCLRDIQRQIFLQLFRDANIVIKFCSPFRKQGSYRYVHLSTLYIKCKFMCEMAYASSNSLKHFLFLFYHHYFSRYDTKKYFLRTTHKRVLYFSFKNGYALLSNPAPLLLALLRFLSVY